jgi:drug/metabolite transporter (DMT)-like permease
MSRFRIPLAFLLLATIWGSSFLFIRIAVRQITPLDVVTLRVFFGSIGIGVIALISRADLRMPRRLFAVLFATASVNTTIPFLLISWGEVSINSGLAAVLNSTTPIFSLLIAHFYLRDERITGPRVAGVTIGFIGVLVLLSDSLGGAGVHWDKLAGEAAVVVASAAYAVGAVMLRRWLREVPVITTSTWVLWIATAQSVVLSLLFSPIPLGSLHGKTVFAVVWLGLLGSAVAYVLYYFLITNWGASHATLVTYVVPAIAVVLGARFLSEEVTWRVIAGFVLIVGGIAMASFMRPRGRSRAAERDERAATAG